MKKLLLFNSLSILLLAIASCSSDGKKESAPVAADSTAIDSAKVTYACPMDTDIVSTVPGSCSKCGMELEKVAAAEKTSH